MKYSIINGELLNLDFFVDVIVNEANPFMSRGGVICGKIHKEAF